MLRPLFKITDCDLKEGWATTAEINVQRTIKFYVKEIQR